MATRYDPKGVEERWQRTWEDEGLYKAGAGRAARRDVRDLRAAAERHRRAAHGPRAERLDPGRADPLPPHARLRHALAAGLRPRRHLDAERRREAADRRGHVAPGDRPRRVPRAHVGLARDDGPHDHGPVPPARLLARLLARAVHDGRRLRRRRDDATSSGSGTPAGSTARTASSTGARTTRRRSPTSRSSTSRWTTRSPTRATRSPTARGVDHDRDRAAGDDPRRRRRRREPERPALRATRSARRSSCRSSGGACP